MLNPRIILACLLIPVAGCSTAPRKRENQPPDWHAPNLSRPVEIEHVREPQLIAPPKTPEPSQAPPTNRTYAQSWIPLNRWSRETHSGSVQRLNPASNPSAALSTSNGVLVVQANSLSAKWDGIEMRLGFAPQWIDDQMFVHELDLRKNIEPLIRGLKLPDKPNPVVVVDPGHGGQNTGTRSIVNQVDEKEFTLDLARRIEPLLAARGWKVFLTRTNDEDLSLSRRVTIADECGADLFISMHFNSAAPNQEQAGLETFCLTPSGMASTLTRGYDDNVSLIWANNAFDSENLQYAVQLHRSLLKTGELIDRGVRRARFLSVLRAQNRPAVLIEAGYLSNPAEARRIADPAFRDKLAHAVARALAGPEDDKPPTTPGTQPPNEAVAGSSD